MLNIPQEYSIQIFAYLSVRDIKNFAQCSKECNTISSDSFLWFKLIHRDFYKIKQPYNSNKDYKILYIRYKNLDEKPSNSFAKQGDIDDWIFFCYK